VYVCLCEREYCKSTSPFQAIQPIDLLRLKLAFNGSTQLSLERMGLDGSAFCFVSAVNLSLNLSPSRSNDIKRTKYEAADGSPDSYSSPCFGRMGSPGYLLAYAVRTVSAQHLCPLARHSKGRASENTALEKQSPRNSSEKRQWELTNASRGASAPTGQTHKPTYLSFTPQ
jgi:hypothetical protein